MRWSALVPAALTRPVLLALLALAALGLGGCARTLEAAPAAPAAIHATWPGCPALGAFDDPQRNAGPPGAGALPDGFVPREAVVCTVGERSTPEGALVQVGLERRATDLGSLLGYLARPSEVSSRPDELVCPAMAVLPVWLFLADAEGRWVTPALPTDACGFPLGTFGGTASGLDQLRYRDTVVQRLRLLEAPEARAAGCSTRWKDLVAIAAAEQPRSAPVRTDPWDGVPLRLCVYRVPAEEQAGPSPTGEFVGGRVLDRRARAGVLAALTGTRAAPGSCDRPAGRFAVLQPAAGGDAVHVELDGCRRVLHGTDLLATGGPDLVRRLEAFGR